MFVVYVCPFFSENTKAFINALGKMEEIRLGIISQEPMRPPDKSLRTPVKAFYRVQDCLNTEALANAVVNSLALTALSTGFLARVSASRCIRSG